jgi:hypothetical protein
MTPCVEVAPGLALVLTALDSGTGLALTDDSRDLTVERPNVYSVKHLIAGETQLSAFGFDDSDHQLQISRLLFGVLE